MSSKKVISTREENDALGSVFVPTSARWGAQTQRCLNNFKIGRERMPAAIIRAYLVVKRACAIANAQTDTISQSHANAITDVCQQLLQLDTMDDFPLKIWQTGSGTATNMNVNEVIAHLANQQMTSASEKKIHPNDHVNCSQSSNDTFPSAMHIAIFSEFKSQFLPALKHLQAVLANKTEAFANITKIGRTHMQDAVPLTLGQAFSAFSSQLSHIESEINRTFDQLRHLALGGTAVGTGINTPQGFRQLAIDAINQWSGEHFLPANNSFHALSAHTEIIAASASLKNLACTLQKLANDIRLMASGPRSGIGELTLPENEPGSSIMPGKVNPTQCEVLHMITIQVIANDVAIGISGASGQFELNVCRPLMAYHMLQSLELLSEGMRSFADNALSELQPNTKKIQENFHNSLMLVTYLTPHIGYAKAAELAHYAHRHELSLREACQALQTMDLGAFDQIIAKSADPLNLC
jgi:fumarate hydratase class II